MKMFNKFCHDLRRYKALNNMPLLIIFVSKRQTWAIFQHRIANSIYQSKIPDAFKNILLALCSLWRILTEFLTGITIRHSATIGKGLYIGHPGMIRISGEAIIGEYCNISSGVTIGVSGRKEKRGVPSIGNRVWIGTNAVVAGKIKVGSKSVIGSNSLVTRDVEESCTVIGVPAIKVSNNDSDAFIKIIEK